MKKRLMFCIICLCLLASCAAQPASDNAISLEASEDGGHMVYTPSDLDRDTARNQQLELWLANLLTSESVEINYENNMYTVTVNGFNETISEETAVNLIRAALPYEDIEALEVNVTFK